jgi:hypothetical protein
MPVGLTDNEVTKVLASLGQEAFSTLEFSRQVEADFPNSWAAIVREYGDRGEGVARHFTAYSRIAQILDGMVRQSVLDKLDFRAAPEGWGSPVIRYWALDRDRLGGSRYPDEILDDPRYQEGTKKTVTVNRHERNRAARGKCIEHYGIKCFACNFDFEERYGSLGAGFIHVHHLKPLSTINEAYEIDPVADLRPVCPNCHAMIHIGAEQLAIEELKKILKSSEPEPRKRPRGV